MLRTASKISRPFLARGVSGVAPTLYLRAKSGVKAAPAPGLRPKVYALQRFAKAQLKLADGADKAALEADIARYQSYLDSDLKPLFDEASASNEAKAKLIPLVDRYPEVSIDQLPALADALQAKLDQAFEVLSKDVAPPTDVDEGYFETSRFQVLEIYSGCVATFPDGDVPPGAVEMLSGQVVHTTVNGEDVMLEIDEVDEGFQLAWFKPEIRLPEGSEVLWSYPHQPLASTPEGTNWDTSADIVPYEEVEFDVPTAPPVKTVANEYGPMAQKLEARSGGELQAAFSIALLNPAELLPLNTDYECTYDREVVESKRDRYYSALLAAQNAPPLPYMPDVAQLQLEHSILKSQLVDFLRQQEFYIANQQLLARLHEKRLAGEIISDWEAQDYQPHVRDDSELATDFGDPTSGRYIWKLFPHLDGDEDALIKDTRFDAMPEEVDPLNTILANHLAATPMHKKLEAKLMTEVSGAM